MAFCFVLNRLLEREPWARERLAPFAGATVEVLTPLLPDARFTILPGGRLEAGGGEPALTATLRPGEVVFSGDERMAAEARLLMRHLRWDVEEDLSRVFGDALAHRMADAARSFFAWQRDAAARLTETLAAYAADEKRMLLRPRELGEHAERIAALGAALDRLAARIGRLE